MGNLLAEAGGNLLVGGGRVLNRVVQQARGDGGCVHLHLRQHLGYLERVDDVGLAGSPRLPFMVPDAELPGLADERNVFAGTVGVDFLEQRLKAVVDDLRVDGACDW